MYSKNSEYLRKLHQKVISEKKECVAGGLIINSSNKIFVQKRAMNRSLFPGCWDIAGGHVELGESIYDALEREIFEETGWRLYKIIDLIWQFDWETNSGNKIKRVREFDFLVKVKGDLDHPIIEKNKFSEFRWIDRTQLEILKENRTENDTAIYQMIKKAFEVL